jgi:hypothetical protein
MQKLTTPNIYTEVLKTFARNDRWNAQGSDV